MEAALSQREQILRHLKGGGEIDAKAALKAYGCFRLAARINDLRSTGHPIETRIVHNRIIGKKYAVYYMQPPKKRRALKGV